MWESQSIAKATVDLPERDTIMLIASTNGKALNEALSLVHQVYALLYGNTTAEGEAARPNINGLYEELKSQKASLDELCCMLKSTLDRLN